VGDLFPHGGVENVLNRSLTGSKLPHSVHFRLALGENLSPQKVEMGVFFPMAALKMYSIGHLQGVSFLIPCIFALPWEKISPHNSANERVMLPCGGVEILNQSVIYYR